MPIKWDTLSPAMQARILRIRQYAANPETIPNSPPAASNVGTHIAAAFTALLGECMPCGDCTSAIRRLNSFTVAELRRDRDKHIDDIWSRRNKVPKLWQKLAVALDTTLRTGIVKHKLCVLFDAACDAEDNKVCE